MLQSAGPCVALQQEGPEKDRKGACWIPSASPNASKQCGLPQPPMATESREPSLAGEKRGVRAPARKRRRWRNFCLSFRRKVDAPSLAPAAGPPGAASLGHNPPASANCLSLSANFATTQTFSCLGSTGQPSYTGRRNCTVTHKKFFGERTVNNKFSC